MTVKLVPLESKTRTRVKFINSFFLVSRYFYVYGCFKCVVEFPFLQS